MLAIANGGTGMTNAQAVNPKWVVTLGGTPSVKRAVDQTKDARDRKSYNIPYTYFIYARDELEAFMKARKMEEEGEEEC